MTSKLLGATATALILISSGSAALAQARRAPVAGAASAPVLPAPRQGPAIPGICVFSGAGAVGASSVGKAASARLQVLQQQVQAELSAEGTPLENDIRTFQSQRASLTQDQQQQRAGGLQQRRDALQQKAQLREQELSATQQRQLGRISQMMNPIVLQVYQAHNCSLLLSGEAVPLSNPTMDLTQQVVQQMNVTMPSITFDRETLPATAATQR